MKALALFFCLLISAPLFAQDAPKAQVKTVVHAPVPDQPSWYLTGWNITNIRQEAPDNTNFMFGIGRKLDNGWVEVMAQRQYAFHSNQWFLDFRVSRNLSKRTTLFVEFSPFLEKPALYHFTRVEYRVGPINLMAESENIYGKRTADSQGIDSLGIGPGLSLPPRRLWRKLKFAPAISWQWRPKDTDALEPGDQDPNFLRFYFVFSS